MAQNNWRTVAEAAADAKCRRFLTDINLIVDTFSADCPMWADAVFDADGEPWPVPPSQMTVADILTFVHQTYGELFVGFCRTFTQLKVH
jgi:hypothetical protein